MEVIQNKQCSLNDWFWAIRPKTLSTAIIPFLAGTMLAFAQGFEILWELMVFAWLSAICIQIGTNITNDAYDYRGEADKGSILGPKRATRKGLLDGSLTFKQVRFAGCCFFILALVFGIPLMLHGGWSVFFILILSALAGYCYTGGPFPLAYHGLGDLFVMVFYGMIATNAAYWLQTGRLSGLSFIIAFQIGCLCTSMIAVNNLRDVFTDVKSNKKTLPVRFGVLFGRIEITIMLLLPLAVNLFLPWNPVNWLPFLTLPLSSMIIRNVWMEEPSQKYNSYLGMSGVNMLIFVSLQTFGFILA